MSTRPPRNPTHRPRWVRPAFFASAACLWLGALAAMFYFLTAYTYRHTPMGTPPSAHAARIPLASDRLTLVMAVHPHCPCTRASIFELERLLVRCPGRIDCRILVFLPEAAPLDWAGPDPFGLASRLTDIHRINDFGGALARSLGCTTSGAVVLYDTHGEPVFWGGITAARGHAGDNLGSDSITAIAHGRAHVRRVTPVYGCALTRDVATASTCCREHTP